MIIDTHSHLSFKAYDKDREEVIKRTLKEGVVCIDVGNYMEQSKDLFVKMQEQLQGSQNLFGSFPFTPQPNKTEKE